MFGFFKRKSSDEEQSRMFVRQVFDLGRKTCRHVAEGVQMSTGGKVSFPISDDVSVEISLAILGTALAVLKGHSQVMTAVRGTQIVTYCKRSIERDYDLSADSAAKMNDALDEYQNAFQRSMSSKNNPFGEVAGIMLVRSLGQQATALCVPGTGALNLDTHQIVGDLVTMTVTQALAFWKGN